ncbi:MAG: ATP-binding protein [Pseudomonadota bacterium]
MAPGACKFSTHFDARLEAVPLALDFVATALRTGFVSDERIARSELILEELFRNAVLHGYAGQAGGVWVGVCLPDDGEPGFWLEDEAAPFNPLAGAGDQHGPDPGQAIAAQPVGGVGLLLIRQLSRHVEHAIIEGRNRTTVTI